MLLILDIISISLVTVSVGERPYEVLQDKTMVALCFCQGKTQTMCPGSCRVAYTCLESWSVLGTPVLNHGASFKYRYSYYRGYRGYIKVLTY
jgi:hypothetical protein